MPLPLDDGTWDYLDNTPLDVAASNQRRSRPYVPHSDRAARQLKPTLDESIAAAGRSFPNDITHQPPGLRKPILPGEKTEPRRRRPSFSIEDRQHIRNALD
ncbi:MAG: hypothetical protein NTU97_02625 [Candidatus Magasanikbacteria bacterium]|nr:hypothetical protein [Candidatus Magasanikbacteria bacterium]